MQLDMGTRNIKPTCIICVVVLYTSYSDAHSHCTVHACIPQYTERADTRCTHGTVHLHQKNCDLYERMINECP